MVGRLCRMVVTFNLSKGTILPTALDCRVRIAGASPSKC